MNNIREFIHKLSTIGELGIPIDCDAGLTANGNVGVYLVDVTIGTDTGWVTLDYEAFNVPDRFQIIYDGNIVADSKYVGDSLGTYIGDLQDSFNLPQKEYDGVQFVNNGTNEAFTNTLADIADGSAAEPTAGMGTIGFIKNTASPSLLRVKAFGPVSGTAWNITLNCAVPINDTITFTTTSNSGAFQADSLIKTGSPITWYGEGDVYKSQEGDTPTFDLTVNNFGVDFTLFESTNITEFSIINKDVISLDVSNNSALTDLDFNNNAITTVTLTNCTGLVNLNVADNSLAGINVSTNTALVSLECENNSLTNLSITNNTALLTLRCDGNALVAGDIDNIIIQLDTNGLSNGTLDIPTGRTAASDAALTSLQGKGWTVTEI